MKHYRHVKDVNDIEQFGDEVYFITPTRHCGYTLAQQIWINTMQMLGKKCDVLKAPRDLSAKSISNCKVPTDVLMYFTKEDKLVNELLRRRYLEDYFDNMFDSFDRMFKYTIDGKEVSHKEFCKYLNKIKLNSAYGETVTKKKGDYYEMWMFSKVAQKDVH